MASGRSNGMAPSTSGSVENPLSVGPRNRWLGMGPATGNVGTGPSLEANRKRFCGLMSLTVLSPHRVGYCSDWDMAFAPRYFSIAKHGCAQRKEWGKLIKVSK